MEQPKARSAVGVRTAWRGLGRRTRIVAVALGGLLLVVAVTLALYVRGGGPLPGAEARVGAPLAPSSPAEVVLRTLRLAGFDRAVVGESGGTVVARLDVPDLVSPADAEPSWQTAIAASVGAYPEADRYVAQVFAEQHPLLEVRVDAEDARDAVERDDPDALKRAAEFRYLTGAGR